MKALVYEGVEQLAIRDVPDPEPVPGEQLVRVEAVGICGSDMHAYLGHNSRRPAPLILGHEAAGTIVGGVRNGDRVTVNPLVVCGGCPSCRTGRDNLCPERQIISMPPREGAFAQLLSMPEVNLLPVPDNIALDKAALAEPLAVGWHAARLALEALHPSMERRALVLGGGAIGLAVALGLKAMGCADVIIAEPHEGRRNYLRDHCRQRVSETPQESCPMVFDAVGYAVTRATASALVEPGGVITHVGLGEDTGGLDIRRMTLQESTFIGTYAYTAQDFRDAAQAISDGALGPLDWFETRELKDGQTAFQALREAAIATPKILLIP